jgi:hypothetical protein
MSPPNNLIPDEYRLMDEKRNSQNERGTKTGELTLSRTLIKTPGVGVAMKVQVASASASAS